MNVSPCPRKFSETFQEQVRNQHWLQKPLIELGLLSRPEWLVVSPPCIELQSNWTLLGEHQKLWIIGVMSFYPRFTFGCHYLFSHTRNMWISHSQRFIESLSFVLRLPHHPVISWSANVTKGRWDRILSPAKERCSLKSTSLRRWWWPSQSTTYSSCLLFWSHFICPVVRWGLWGVCQYLWQGKLSAATRLQGK